jgi:putative endonuclease
MIEHKYYVYILSNRKDGVLYIGVTNNLEKRVSEHKNKRYKTSFSARYNVDKLVYYEEFQWIQEALKREKVLKKWKREWKIELVVNNNPNWYDLSLEW